MGKVRGEELEWGGGDMSIGKVGHGERSFSG